MTANPHMKSATRPAADFAVVTPSNTDDLPQPCRALWVGVGGDVTAVSLTGATVQFKNVPSGYPLPIIARRITVAGTNASSLVALY